MITQNAIPEPRYLTTGQVAKTLRVSVSTIKRWLREYPELCPKYENASGWRLFTFQDVEQLKLLKKGRKKYGKVFRPSTLRPVEAR